MEVLESCFVWSEEQPEFEPSVLNTTVAPTADAVGVPVVDGVRVKEETAVTDAVAADGVELIEAVLVVEAEAGAWQP